MANMHFVASIYGSQRGLSAPRGVPSALGVNATQGVVMSFPSTGTIFYPIVPGTLPTGVTQFNGVTVNTVIEVYPQGLNQPSVKYFTPTDVTTLDTAAK